MHHRMRDWWLVGCATQAEWREERAANGLPERDFAAEVPAGARHCDELCFGAGIYERVYTGVMHQQKHGGQSLQQEERHPLLA